MLVCIVLGWVLAQMAAPLWCWVLFWIAVALKAFKFFISWMADAVADAIKEVVTE